MSDMMEIDTGDDMATRIVAVGEAVSRAAEELKLAAEQLLAEEDRVKQAEVTARTADEQIRQAELRAERAAGEAGRLTSSLADAEAKAAEAAAKAKEATDRFEELEERTGQAELRARAAEEQAAHTAAKSSELLEELQKTRGQLAEVEGRFRRADERAHEAEEKARLLDVQSQELKARLAEIKKSHVGGMPVVADKERSTLKDAVAGEVRRPLTSILGIALAMKHTDPKAADGQEMIRQLSSNARKLDRLVSVLLELERLMDGSLKPNRRRTRRQGVGGGARRRRCLLPGVPAGRDGRERPRTRPGDHAPSTRRSDGRDRLDLALAPGAGRADGSGVAERNPAAGPPRRRPHERPPTLRGRAPQKAARGLAHRGRRAGASGAERLQDVAGHDDALDLVRPLVDLRDLRIAHHPLHGILADVAVAPEDLNGVGRDLHGGIRREALRGGREVRHPWIAGVTQGERAIDQQPGGFDLHRHVGQHELDGLEVDDPLPELLSLRRVPRRDVECPLRDAQGLRRDGRPRIVEGLHGIGEALALLADQPVGGDPAVLQDHLAGRRSPDPHLVLLPAEGDAGVVPHHEECRDTLRLPRGVCGGEHDVGLRYAGSGDEPLGPRQDERIALVRIPGGHRGRV